MSLASFALARLQVEGAPIAPLLVFWVLPLYAFSVAFDFVLFPFHAFSTAFNSVLFLHALLAAIVLSCFFVCFLPLWLCTVSICFTSAKSKFILIPLHKDVMGFLPYIVLGLPNPFALFSFHLFTTLGWAYWPFYFLSFIFIYSPHWVALWPFYFLFSRFILLGLTYWALFCFSTFMFF